MAEPIMAVVAESMMAAVAESMAHIYVQTDVGEL
jgi:hypothetical protein